MVPEQSCLYSKYSYCCDWNLRLSPEDFCLKDLTAYCWAFEFRCRGLPLIMDESKPIQY